MYADTKKYSILNSEHILNKDITITQNGTYSVPEGYSGYGVVRVLIPDTVLQPKTVTPTTEQQTINPTGNIDGFNKIIVNPVTASIDNNIVAENIKEGITILGVQGTFDYTTQNLEITPTTLSQIIEPSECDGFGTITVNGVDNSIDANIIASNIVKDVTILGVTGTAIAAVNTTRNINENGTYTPPNNFTGFSQVVVDVPANNSELNITPSLIEQTFTPTDNYHGFGPVTVSAVDASVDNNIVPANIKSGVTILGVTGTSQQLNAQSLTITENGTYTPQSPYNAFSDVSVEMTTVNNQDITITDSGVYEPEEGYTGFGTVTVDLSWVEEALQGVNAGDSETPVQLQTLTVTDAGTYTPDPGYDGIGSITVDLDWVDVQMASIASNYTNTTVDNFLQNSCSQLNTDATSIRNYACYNMTSLQEATLTSATYIGNYAFYGTNLTTLTISTTSLCTMGNNVIPNTIEHIYVPSDLVSAYKTSSSWSSYASIISEITYS